MTSGFITIPFNYFAEAEKAGGIAVLGIDVKTLVIQIVTFLLVFIILKKFAFGPIVKSLEERYQKIESSINKAEQLERSNQEAEMQIELLLREARKQAEVIINKSRDEAKDIVLNETKAAESKAKKIISDGLAQVDQQVIKASDQLKKETLQLVAQATSTLLSEKVDVKKHEQLILKSLQNLNKGKKS